jgi:[protein-PII] uridylyltransferase
VVDAFYVTDLFGAKITSATRQATIKRALIALLSPGGEAQAKLAKSAATSAATV